MSELAVVYALGELPERNRNMQTERGAGKIPHLREHFTKGWVEVNLQVSVRTFDLKEAR